MKREQFEYYYSVPNHPNAIFDSISFLTNVTLSVKDLNHSEMNACNQTLMLVISELVC